jgi:Fe-S cluster assembly protein SufD
MSDLAQTNAYVDMFVHASNDLPGNGEAWVQQVRKKALARFVEQGFPTRRDEDWKYTNVGPIQKSVFQLPDKELNGVAHEQLDAFLFRDLLCHKLVFVNGHYSQALTSLGTLPDGVSVDSLAQTLRNRPDALRLYLGQCATTEKYGFVALNTAFLSDGAYVHVPTDIIVPAPIHVLFVSTGDSDETLVQPRNLIVVEKNSQVTIIESYVSLTETRHLTNAVTEIVAHENCAIEHYKVGQESLKAFHIGGLYVQQKANSRFTSHNITLGGALVRNNIQESLGAEGGECVLNGLYLATGRQHVDNHTDIDHAQPHCTSREFYKGVLDGRAHAVFNGRIIVRQDAQHTDAQQENKNLLLSRGAEVDTKPQLEIYADDVKCAHGATVGQLDENAIYYLRSRGISEEDARSVLTYAFADDVLRRIGIHPIRTYVEEKLATRLLHGRQFEELT